MRAPATASLACGALAAFAALGLGGCFTPTDGGACRSDRDCSEAVCSNIGECAASTYRLRIAWTLRGLTADQPGACSGIAELELVVSDPSVGQDWSVRPVPCSIGSFLFDKMPLGYGSATVNAYGAGGELLTSAAGSTDPSAGTISVDLRP